MDAPPKPSLLTRCLGWLTTRVARDEELMALTLADYELMAADIGITPEQLREVAPRIGDHSWQVAAMMRANGVDPDQVRRDRAPVMRDLEVMCALCHKTGRCRRELAMGAAAEAMHKFCINAETIQDLAAPR